MSTKTATGTKAPSRKKIRKLTKSQRKQVTMFLRRLMVVFACTFTITTFWATAPVMPILVFGHGIHMNTLCGMFVGLYIAHHTR